MAIEKYLRPSEAGEILGVGGTTASRWAKEGKIVYYETNGGQVRFRRKDVESYKRKMENEAAAKKAAEEQKQARKRKRVQLSPLQQKLRAQMKRTMGDRIRSCRTGENTVLGNFDVEELESLIPNRRIQWVIFLYEHTLYEEAIVSPRELTIDAEKRIIKFRERDERRFRTVSFDRVYGVK